MGSSSLLMYAAKSSMGGEADEYFSSEEEVCNFMPFELSYSSGERWFKSMPSIFRTIPRIFWSKKDNELQRILCSSCPSIDISTSQNEPIKEKIKVFLQRLRLPSLSGFDCLIQFWAPVRIADEIYLSTADQAFVLHGLHKGLCAYRRNCLENILIPVDVDQLGDEEYNLGPPGRVFRHGLPEFSDDIRYYLSKEYVGLDCALQLGLRGYMAFPLFESAGQHCNGVLEVLSIFSTNFMEWKYAFSSVSEELKKMDLVIERFPLHRHIYVHDYHEASGIFERLMTNTGCRHQLPLVLLWGAHFNAIYLHKAYEPGPCVSHLIYLPMRVGQGVVGKALSNRSACFCKDVSKLSLRDYPLVTFARKRGLSSCFAICLKSTKADHFYVLEFLLPCSGIDFGDPRTFVNKLVAGLKKDIRKFNNFIQKIKKRLFVEVIKISSDQDDLNSFEVDGTRRRPSVSEHPEESEMMQHGSLHQQVGETNNARSNSCAEQIDVLGSTQLEGRLIGQGETPLESLMESDITIKERNITSEMQCDVEILAGLKCAIRTLDVERGITREVLQQHSGKKLTEVAKILGVSRSTLKRICRKHEIFKWPPNRSNRPVHQDSTCPANENIDAHSMPSTIKMQECSNILVKVKYGEDVWKFHLSLSAKQTNLEQQLAKRLNSSASSFRIKYLDEENEWISVSCDEDLKFCIETYRSQGKTMIDMLVN